MNNENEDKRCLPFPFAIWKFSICPQNKRTQRKLKYIILPGFLIYLTKQFFSGKK